MKVRIFGYCERFTSDAEKNCDRGQMLFAAAFAGGGLVTESDIRQSGIIIGMMDGKNMRERAECAKEKNDKTDTAMKPRILLHSCCGPCSTAVIERLSERYDITVYFYNPNITDEAEYERRWKAQQEVISKFNESRPESTAEVKLEQGPYDPERFLEAVRGFEEDVYKRQAGGSEERSFCGM